jgi:hypothetical protein
MEFGAETQTSNAKSVESAPTALSSVGRIASLLIFPLLIFPFRAISRLFTDFRFLAKEFRGVVISG